MRTSFTPAQWSSGLAVFLDLLALGALSLTDEVPLWVFGFAGAAFALSRAVRFAVPIRLLALLFLPAILGAFALWLGFKLHPIRAVASVVPFVHLLLWFAPANPVYRGWRMGLGFVELIVASGLTAEAYLPVSISLFVVIASVAISCDFLDRELAERAPESRGELLSGAFIRNSAGLAVMIFLTAAVIFPILPRPKGMAGQLGLTQGYTESVNVSEWGRMRQDSEGVVALRLYPVSEDADLTTGIYLGLLRGRALDLFDGSQWHASPRSKRSRAMSELPPVPEGARAEDRIQISVVREKITADTLPAPYGTRVVSVESEGQGRKGTLTRSGDWEDEYSLNQRVRYSVDLLANDLRYLREGVEADPPSELHRSVPARTGTERLEKLARRIFAGAESPREKMIRVGQFFRTEGFQVTSAETPEDAGMEDQLRRIKMTPLEQFLFVRKQGHCEWFATASAVLLRLAEVPTRLVAGFRLTSSAIGGVLTVRSSDGHAWVEVFSPESGWIPFDPTPRVHLGSTWKDQFRQISDLFGAYWYKHVVSYGEDSARTGLWAWIRDILKSEGAFRRQHRASGALSDTVGPDLGVLALAALSLLAGGLVYAWRRKGAAGEGGHPRLRRERRRMARSLKFKDIDPGLDSAALLREIRDSRGAEAAHDFQRWQERYLLLRFGASRDEAGFAELEELGARVRAQRHEAGSRREAP